MEPAITVTNLRKTFRLSAKQRKLERTDARTKTAVDGLTFEVRRGEIYGLLGPNGAGKTTTLRMLAALVKPDEGSAFVEGVSVVDDPMRVRGIIGFLTSELKLEETFSPDYLFDFFSELHHVEPAVRDARKKELKGQGKTILLSTHIFSLVEKVCDRAGIVIGGRMAASGTLPELTQGRSLEDAFFDLYAASVGEAS